MFFTAVCLSKASRRALTPKRGNKDFYKGVLVILLVQLFYCRFMDNFCPPSRCPFIRLSLYYFLYFFPFNAHIACRNQTSISPWWTPYRCPGKTCHPRRIEVSFTGRESEGICCAEHTGDPEQRGARYIFYLQLF
jgi:hypothetical protein